MPAAAPSSDLLTPYVGPLHDAVIAALSALLGLPLDTSSARLQVEAGTLQLQAPQLRMALSGASPDARAAGEALRIRVERARPEQRRLVQAGLMAAERADRMATLAASLDAWWPFADLPDEEFRRVSSSPRGAYGTLRLGYRCNQDCWFCWQDRRAPSPPLEHYQRWLDELAALGVHAVNFTGGEATTWSALPDLVARAEQLGMVPTLQSNAIKLARPDYTRRLVDAGLHAVMVSLHSSRPEVSDRMTRAPGTFRRTVAGIGEALRQGLLVTLTCVVEAANHDHLDEHAAFVAEHFAGLGPGQLVRVTYAHPTTYFKQGGWQEHQVPFDTLRPQLSAAVARLRAAGVPVQVGGPCGFPVCALDPDVVGDPYQVLERSVFTPEELVHRRFAEACEGCSHQARCFGLRSEYLERFGDQGLKPVPVS